MGAILRPHRVGRIACVPGGRVEIQPSGDVYGDGAIHPRAVEGAKVNALRRGPRVAFEVDEVRRPFDWRRMVARGTVYEPTPRGRGRTRPRTRAARRCAGRPTPPR